MKSFSHSLSIILNREYNTQLSLPWLNICRISNPLARDWIYQDSPMFSLCVRGCSPLQFSTYFFTVCSCSLGTRWQGESWGLSSCTSFRPVRDSSSGPGPDITNYSSEELGHAHNLQLSIVTSSTLSCKPTTLTPNHSHDRVVYIYNILYMLWVRDKNSDLGLLQAATFSHDVSTSPLWLRQHVWSVLCSCPTQSKEAQ